MNDALALQCCSFLDETAWPCKAEIFITVSQPFKTHNRYGSFSFAFLDDIPHYSGTLKTFTRSPGVLIIETAGFYIIELAHLRTKRNLVRKHLSFLKNHKLQKGVFVWCLFQTEVELSAAH